MSTTSHASLPSVPFSMSTFTRPERASLHNLRARYLAGGDFLSASELVRLRFTRWLYLNGRLDD
jgi:hypothetical protein